MNAQVTTAIQNLSDAIHISGKVIGNALDLSSANEDYNSPFGMQESPALFVSRKPAELSCGANVSRPSV